MVQVILNEDSLDLIWDFKPPGQDSKIRVIKFAETKSIQIRYEKVPEKKRTNKVFRFFVSTIGFVMGAALNGSAKEVILIVENKDGKQEKFDLPMSEETIREIESKFAGYKTA
jgi:hypothetical protein